MGIHMIRQNIKKTYKVLKKQKISVSLQNIKD